MAGYIKAISGVARSSMAIRAHLKRLNCVDYDAFYREFDIEQKGSEYFHSQKHFNRCRQYVKAFGLLAMSLSDLLDREINDREFKNLLLLAHFAPVFDDLFDKQAIPLHRIKAFITSPEKQIAGNGREHLFLSYYIPFHDLIPDRATTEKFLIRLAESEVQISHDPNKIIEAESLIWKGGHSCLVIRSLYPEKISQAEETALFRLGMLTQVMDDLFDVSEDLSTGKTTFVTFMKDPEKVRSYYQEKMQSAFKVLKGTQHQLKQVLRFVNQMNLLLSPAFNCIEYYKKISLTRFTPEDLAKHEGKELVCDMETMSQVVRLLSQSVKNHFRININ